MTSMFLRSGLGRHIVRPQLALKPILRPARRFQHNGPDMEDYLLPGQKSARNILKGFIAANAVVFLAWQFSITRTKGESPDLVRTKNNMARELNDKFVLRSGDIAHGNYYGALLSHFSHVSTMHFGFNMMAFWSLGNGIIMSLPLMTGPRFLTLCLGSALGSTVATYANKQSRGISNGSLGASGLISGIAAAIALRAPFAKMQFIFIPVGIPAWVLTGGFFAYSAYSVAAYDPRNPPLLDHAGHLGGAVFGALYYFMSLRRGRIPGAWR
ncbi:hypothetical protein BKA80DRAFT_281826 [Phyllosticta citrichinensis]